VAADALIVNLFEGVTSPGGATGAVDRALGGLISEAIRAGDFRGDFMETCVLYTGGRIPARKVVVVGLGTPEKFDYRRVRQVSAAAARAARKSGARSIATIVHGAGIGGLDPRMAAQFTVDGIYHGLFQFEGYKTNEKAKQPKRVEEVLVVEADAAKLSAVEEGAQAGRIIAESVNWARTLGMMPANKLTAGALADAAQAMAAEVGLACEIYDKAGCERLGLGLLLAVNQGSAEEPRLIVLRHKGAGGQGPWLGLVGKGLTFDSGGYSIKPNEGMWDMKFDMMGGAAVLAAMRAVALLGVKADILAVVPATDNMVDGKAYRPGDVLQGLSGKTVEIRSTDAEGRLILADGLAYAIQEGAAKLITASTLTGGITVALGSVRFGVMANDEAWQQEVLSASQEAGEKGWPLPLDEEYGELLKSPVADMTNGHGRPAHAIQGGLFLMKHVGKVPTVHLDIAATAWRQAANSYEEAGATGVATRTLIRAAQRWAEGELSGARSSACT
jgi:leucyl aminopeptidase